MGAHRARGHAGPDRGLGLRPVEPQPELAARPSGSWSWWVASAVGLVHRRGPRLRGRMAAGRRRRGGDRRLRRPGGLCRRHHRHPPSGAIPPPAPPWPERFGARAVRVGAGGFGGSPARGWGGGRPGAGGPLPAQPAGVSRAAGGRAGQAPPGAAGLGRATAGAAARTGCQREPAAVVLGGILTREYPREGTGGRAPEGRQSVQVGGGHHQLELRRRLPAGHRVTR